ncbi:hypothetical protein GCM10010174_34960 [Kutzneria viridogrisea]|uniref:Uncharacterized protein n=1 Tax=Kutzneria viridogrisea TaxID=47990 RepID=A0ABR6BLD5_9PSEU|nr:hypothetical protein [Kutzneria viridogrisea]
MAVAVDNAVEEIEGAMRHLKDTMRGIPVSVPGFRAAHERARKAMGELTVALTDAQSKVTD